MKSLMAITFLCLINGPTSSACTTFFINKNGQMVFGRNYDWITATGMVCTNLRGLQKISMKAQDGPSITWVSDYGSITFNQYGKEFPTGGMNEKGLVVELMWLDGTKYPNADDRPAVNVLQWIQYQLDKSSTVDEVIATDKILRITSHGTPLHYLVADAKGTAATIEFLKGKMVVHKGQELPFAVLTNNTYDESITKTKGMDNSRLIADNSIDRFAKACNRVQEFQVKDINSPVVDYAFSILDEVSQNDWTKWSIVYDLTNMSVNFKTRDFAKIKTVSFSSFDFACTASPKMLNINQPAQGDVSPSFKIFSIAESKPILENAIEESKGQVTIRQQEKEGILNYTREIKCK